MSKEKKRKQAKSKKELESFFSNAAPKSHWTF
jgi:hypothetical protein